MLAACVGLPPQLALVTQAADGVSYVFTGRSGTDHIVSAAMEKDCTLARALQGQAICKAEQGGAGFAQALSQVEGGHPGAALDRPIGHDEIVALDPVFLPPEMADIAPALGGAAIAPHRPVIGSAAFADPGRLLSPAGQSKPASRTDAAKSDPTPVSGRAKVAPAPPAEAKASPRKAPRPKATQKPRPDQSYYVVVGTYRNWVTALENAGRQSQGVASVVTATRNGAKTHRVLIGPLDHRRARDTRRLVRGEGFRSARLVPTCASGPDHGRGQACMDLRKAWR